VTNPDPAISAWPALTTVAVDQSQEIDPAPTTRLDADGGKT
jgi:hypothetical protein